MFKDVDPYKLPGKSHIDSEPFSEHSQQGSDSNSDNDSDNDSGSSGSSGSESFGISTLRTTSSLRALEDPYVPGASPAAAPWRSEVSEKLRELMVEKL
ncbi:hypothetical protein ACOMHN_059261 [Nucella lapillus]